MMSLQKKVTVDLWLPKRTPPQIRLANSTKRFNVASWGRQSGKTTNGTWKFTYKPLQGRDGGVYWYILQNYAAAEIVFRRFWDLHRDSGLLLGKPHESDLHCTLINNAMVHFKSGKNFEDLRAETLDGCIIDEYRQQSPHLWSRVVYPMLARFNAWCDIYSTPNGFDHFHDIAEHAKANPKNWGFFHAPSTEAPWWTPEMIEEAKRTMSEAEFAQEILAEFRDITSDRAYISYGAHNKFEQNPFAAPGEIASPHLPVWLFCDFNLAPMAWIIAQEHKKHVHAFNEVYIPRTLDQFEAPRLLVSKLMQIKDVHKMPLFITGDASGKATQRTSHKSDYDILLEFLRSKGFRPQLKAPAANPGIKDRVTTMNARLRAANGEVFVTINPKMCPELDIDLTRTLWKKTDAPTLDPGPENIRTHPSDALGYGVCTLAPTEVRGQTGRVGVIRRDF
jgi:hypothetical protein